MSRKKFVITIKSYAGRSQRKCSVQDTLQPEQKELITLQMAQKSASLSKLSAEENALLRDITQPEQKELVTLETAQELLDEGKYSKALVSLLELKQQKVERVWHKGKIGNINSICLRQAVNHTKREIIVGASNGVVYAFTNSGRQAWKIELKERIIDMQTGFVDNQKQEDIVICTSDHQVYSKR